MYRNAYRQTGLEARLLSRTRGFRIGYICYDTMEFVRRNPIGSTWRCHRNVSAILYIQLFVTVDVAVDGLDRLLKYASHIM